MKEPTGGFQNSALNELFSNIVARDNATESGIPQSSSPSSGPTSSSSASSNPESAGGRVHSTDVGAIAGGVVGGVLGLALIAGLVFFFFFLRRGRRLQQRQQQNGYLGPVVGTGKHRRSELPTESYDAQDWSTMKGEYDPARPSQNLSQWHKPLPHEVDGGYSGAEVEAPVRHTYEMPG